MKNFLKFLFMLLILVLVFGGGYFYLGERNCQVPLKYSIGSVDPRFKLSNENIKNIAEKSAGIWDSGAGDNLVFYDPNSTMKINFVYDNRQASIDELKSKKAAIDSTNQSLTEWKASLEQEINSYQQELAAHNAKVQYWNSRGGAPADVYQQLQSEASSLDAERARINKSLDVFSLQIDQYNSNVNSLNNQLDSQKNQIETEGEYNSDTNQINIYIVDTTPILEVTISHELGHALGLNHVQNPQAIMYYFIGGQDLKNIRLAADDTNQLERKCRLKLWWLKR